MGISPGSPSSRREHPRWKKSAFWAGALLVVCLGLWISLSVAAVLTLPQDEASGYDPRPLLLCLSLTGLNALSYLVWPSRWNIPAHAQLAFSVVAYIVPIFFLDGLSTWSPQVVDLYFGVMISGFACAAIGTVIGGWVASLRGAVAFGQRLVPSATFLQVTIPNRVRSVIIVAVVALIACFLFMGFAPALAADPFMAKFFRGEYAEPYRPVAPIYRAATTALTLFIPLAALQAWRRRNLGGMLILAAALTVMILSLQREPAVSGVLLLLGAALAVHGSGMVWYFVALLGVYFVGSGMYFVLASLGFEAFAQGASVSRTWLQEVAAGSPDIADQLLFLSQWSSRPSYTNGLTFVGGLIPGNFRWNPSVWTLAVVNPGVDVSSIVSGGLRLPAPIWGLVSFGWPGVFAVSALHGFFVGLLAGFARNLIPKQGVAGAIILLVVYSAFLDVLPVFFRLSYLSVLQLVIVLLVVYFRPARGQFSPNRELGLTVGATPKLYS